MQMDKIKKFLSQPPKLAGSSSSSSSRSAKPTITPEQIAQFRRDVEEKHGLVGKKRPREEEVEQPGAKVDRPLVTSEKQKNPVKRVVSMDSTRALIENNSSVPYMKVQKLMRVGHSKSLYKFFSMFESQCKEGIQMILSLKGTSPRVTKRIEAFSKLMEHPRNENVSENQFGFQIKVKVPDLTSVERSSLTTSSLLDLESESKSSPGSKKKKKAKKKKPAKKKGKKQKNDPMNAWERLLADKDSDSDDDDDDEASEAEESDGDGEGGGGMSRGFAKFQQEKGFDNFEQFINLC